MVISMNTRFLRLLACLFLILFVHDSWADNSLDALITEVKQEIANNDSLVTFLTLDTASWPEPGILLMQDTAWIEEAPVATLAVLMRQSDPRRAYFVMRFLEQILYTAARDDSTEYRAQVIADVLLQAIPAMSTDLSNDSLDSLKGVFRNVYPDIELVEPDQNDSIVETDSIRLQYFQSRLLEWVSHILPYHQVGVLLPLMQDSRLAADVLHAVSRVPGPDATRFLIDALEVQNDDIVKLAIQLLQQRVYPESTAGLLDLAEGADRETQWACLDALSYHGIVPMRVMPPASDFTSDEQMRYARAGLRAAGILADQGNRDTPGMVFNSFTDIAAFRHQLRAALVGLAKVASPRFSEHALGYVTTPGIRETAIRLLSIYPDIMLDNRLVRAYEASETAQKIVMLEILAARGAHQLPELLDSAIDADSPDLRCVAMWMQGKVPATEDLFEVANLGAPWIRERALADILAIDQGISTSNQLLDISRAILRSSLSDNLKLKALKVIAERGDLSDQELLLSAISNISIQEEALQAFLEWGHRHLDEGSLFDAFRDHLAGLTFSPQVAASIGELFGWDADRIENLLQHWGYLTVWELLGPFPLTNEGLDKQYFQEQRGASQRVVTFEERDYRWQSARVVELPGAIYLDECAELPDESGVFYAQGQLFLEDWESATVYVQATGDYTLSLNGKQVETASGEPPLPGLEEPYELLFRPGENTLGIKMLRPEVTWQFSVRLFTRRGVPYNVTPLLSKVKEQASIGIQPDILLDSVSAVTP